MEDNILLEYVALIDRRSLFLISQSIINISRRMSVGKSLVLYSWDCNLFKDPVIPIMLHTLFNNRSLASVYTKMITEAPEA